MSMVSGQKALGQYQSERHSHKQEIRTADREGQENRPDVREEAWRAGGVRHGTEAQCRLCLQRTSSSSARGDSRTPRSFGQGCPWLNRTARQRLECAELAPAVERYGSSKAGANSTHSIRFARFGCRCALLNTYKLPGYS